MRQIRKRLPLSGGNNLWNIVQRLLTIFKLRPIGRDHLARIVAKNGLQVGRRKATRVKTTYSSHNYAVQPNLLHEIKAQAPNEVLAADITYIHLRNAHAYLFLITDTFSKMIVGYYLSDSLSHKGAIEALNMALEHIPNPQGVIHHSDRGVQYCCYDFLDEIKKWNFRASMTDSEHCAQNALAECINGILKSEFLLDSEFLSFSQAKQVLDDVIFTYNHLRIHGSLNGKTPVEVHHGSSSTIELWAKELMLKGLPTPPDFINI